MLHQERLQRRCIKKALCGEIGGVLEQTAHRCNFFWRTQITRFWLAPARTGATSPFERTSAKVFHHPTEPVVCAVANNSCGANLVFSPQASEWRLCLEQSAWARPPKASWAWAILFSICAITELDRLDTHRCGEEFGRTT